MEKNWNYIKGIKLDKPKNVNNILREIKIKRIVNYELYNTIERLKKTNFKMNENYRWI